MNILDRYYNDLSFNILVNDILENDKFKKIDNYRHHGMTRLEHSVKVSYYSYKIAKKLRLNYRAVARAGLLHDFFVVEDMSSRKQ